MTIKIDDSILSIHKIWTHAISISIVYRVDDYDIKFDVLIFASIIILFLIKK